MNVKMTNEEYHADVTRISKSGLDLIAKSPLHYWHRYLNPDAEREDETKALLIGSAVHAAILEPHVFVEQFAAIPECDRRTTAGKAIYAEFAAANEGKKLLTADDFKQVTEMAKSVRSHRAAATILADGVAEQTYLFTDPETGAPCKMKTDWITGSGFIVDIKTTEDASTEAFGRSAYSYRYDVQAAFYSDGLKHAVGEAPRGFVFIAVEKKAPYAVAIYHANSHVLEMGRERYRADLETYVNCRRTNQWKGYGDEITPLNLPAYAFRKNNQI